MFRLRAISTIVVVLCTVAAADKFPVNRCSVPYNEDVASTKLDIDKQCGLPGNAAKNSPEAAQNLFKNNLCSAGPAQVVAVDDLVALQDNVDKTGLQYGNKFRHRPGPPLDRSVFQTLKAANGKTLKEGGLVTVVGYLVEAHYMPKSPSGSGETCNCGLTQHDEVDIHLAISEQLITIDKKDILLSG